MNQELSNKKFLYLLWARICIVAFVSCFLIMLFLPKKQILLLVWALVFVFSFSVYAPIFVKCYKSEILSKNGEKFLRLKNGVFFKNERIVFFKNIQYVKLSCGLIEKVLGLETLTVYSAGAKVFIIGLSKNSNLSQELLSLKEGGDV